MKFEAEGAGAGPDRVGGLEDGKQHLKTSGPGRYMAFRQVHSIKGPIQIGWRRVHMRGPEHQDRQPYGVISSHSNARKEVHSAASAPPSFFIIR